MKSWYSIRAAASGVEILIYEEIGLYGITAKMFMDELRPYRGQDLSIRINSPGGSVFDGLAIYNAIKRHKGNKTVTIDGIAASIASVIAMAGDQIVMPSNAMMMIHDPSAFCIGTAQDMRVMAEALDRIKGSLVTAYTEKSEQESQTVEEMMNEEVWLSADEAHALGFCDRIEEAAPFEASFDLSRFKNTPADFLAPHSKPEKETPMDKENTNDNAPEPEDTPPAAPAAQPPESETSEAQAYASTIVNICTLAGMKDKALDFIAKGLSVAETSAALLTAKAAMSEATAITSAITDPQAGEKPEPTIDTAAIYAARNQRKS